MHTSDPQTAEVPSQYGKDVGITRATSKSMKNKLSDLRKCINRVARTASAHTIPTMRHDNKLRRRFIGLWQARNRRTRVLMLSRVREALCAV